MTIFADSANETDKELAAVISIHKKDKRHFRAKKMARMLCNSDEIHKVKIAALRRKIKALQV